jgi:hypothetical protein
LMSSSNSVLDAAGPTDSILQGPAIDDIFKLGGGGCRTHRQRPPGGLPMTSLATSVVDAAGPTDSAPHRWPTNDVIFNHGGGRCWTHRWCPQGARHGRPLQTRCWTLPDPPVAPRRGPPSTSSSKLVVDAAGPASSAPQGGCHRRRLQTRWSTQPDPPKMPPREPTIHGIFNLGGGRCRTRRQRPPRGPPSTLFSN